MSVLDHLAQAAAVLLLLELLVLLVIFAAVAGGLAFGLRWIRGKSGWAFQKANSYLELAAKGVHVGTDYAARPVIRANGLTETVKVTAEAVRSRVRALRSPAPAGVAVSAVREVEVAIPSAGTITQPVGAVVASADDTVVLPAAPERIDDPVPPTVP